jgi:hypothetical protein
VCATHSFVACWGHSSASTAISFTGGHGLWSGTHERGWANLPFTGLVYRMSLSTRFLGRNLELRKTASHLERRPSPRLHTSRGRDADSPFDQPRSQGCAKLAPPDRIEACIASRS